MAASATLAVYSRSVSLLTPGTRLGPYEIIAPIGAGGMGEVYRARDTKLKRAVAIKVLPAAFANDADRLARFTREAQVLASLNHPNIAAIYAVEIGPGLFSESGHPEKSPGPIFTALVMELVEGEDLSVLIARGAVPLSDALAIAKQIADGLEAAHELGIVHRDLKPANIKVRSDGTVKVLDFGLAKAMDPVGASSAEAMNSPTITAYGTQIGMIIGTAAYMSPEQAKGKAADRRADVWAFGVVLFEMLTGHRLFDGETLSEVMASVMKDEPDWKRLPANLPASILRLLRRCLEKDPKKRLGSMSDARLELAESESVSIETPAMRSRTLPLWMAVAIAAAAIVVTTLVCVSVRPAPSGEMTTVTSTVLLPPDVRVNPGGNPARSGGLAVSRDGRQIAFVGRSAQGSQIFVRAVDSAVARPVAGTEAGAQPVWSPDGRRIAFWQAGKLKQISSEGGAAQIITDISNPRSSAAWGPDDTLLYHVDYRQALTRVSASGGASTVVLPELADNVSWFSPVWLPDGHHFLIVRFAYADDQAPSAGIYVGTVDSPDTTLLVAGRIAEIALGTDELFYRQGTELIARPFNSSTFKLSGAPRTISNHASMIAAGGPTLVYFDPRGGLSAGHRVVLVSRSGAQLSTIGDAGTFRDPRLSPDGRSLAIARAEENGLFGIWKYDLARNIDTRVTGTTFVAPSWSPDSRSIFIGSASGVRRFQADGSSTPEMIWPSKSYVTVDDISPDGRTALLRLTKSSKYQAAVMPVDGRAEPNPISAELSDGLTQAFSPDGHWIATTITQNNNARLQVRPYPGPGAAIAVTAKQASFPRWRGDGRELFFLSVADGVEDIWSVPVTWAAGLPDFGAAQLLFKLPNIVASNLAFDVTKDGQRFVAVIGGDLDPSPLTMMIRTRVR